MKAVLEEVLEEEMIQHLGACYRELTPTRRGEHTKATEQAFDGRRTQRYVKSPRNDFYAHQAQADRPLVADRVP